MTYDHDNRLTNFNGSNVTIDGQGNMTYGPGTNNTFLTYTYDARNRLTSSGGVSYGYDPANNRTALTNGPTNETFVVDPKTSQVLMRIKAGVTNYYIYGAGLQYEIDMSASGTNTLYYHYDSRGSTVALTDSNGNITDRMEYSAYGMLTYRVGTNDTPFLYNGRYGVQTDPNGLLYMRARYYNPYICRFLNADPSGFAGGLNMYQYADGNPISEMDPFGLCAENSVSYSWLTPLVGDLNSRYRSHLPTGLNTLYNASATMHAGLEYFGNVINYVTGQAGVDSGALAMLPVVGIAGDAGAVASESTSLELGASETWGNASTLERHFADHGADFGATSAQNYANQASQCFQNSQAAGLPTKLDATGVIRVYDPTQNIFGAFNPNGTTRTFFQPTSPTYFQRQPGTLVP